MTLEDTTMLLRPTAHTDLSFVLATESAEENRSFILPYTPERHLQAINSQQEEHWMIVDRQRQHNTGFVLLAKDDANKSLEFRRLVVAAKGMGIGRQCLKTIKRYCFEQLQYHRLWLDVFDFNHKAIGLYKTEGFTEEGKLVECLYHEGQYRNLLILSMLRSEY